MSAQQGWALQQAIHARLTAALVGLGPSGVNIPIYDHVPANPPRVHARLDGFNTVQRQVKFNGTMHALNVHIFDRPTAESSGARGTKVIRQAQEAVVASLHGWQPSAVTGASAIHHEDSFVSPDEDGLTAHAYSRFSVLIK